MNQQACLHQACVQVRLLDVASLRSVRSFAAGWGEQPVHLLVNNAGIFDFGGAQLVVHAGPRLRACHHAAVHVQAAGRGLRTALSPTSAPTTAATSC